MKMNKIYVKLLSLAGILCFGGVLQSCDDYLTVYPTDQITEEKFWEDKNDLNNVRAGAYTILNRTTPSVMLWGELRSDNFKLMKLDNTSLLHLQEGVLMPSENMFSWSTFYTGINYCNLVLSRGQQMVNKGVDPSLGTGEWRPIKAEMEALRALYYFYLIRAFRDVPYVSEPVSTDKQAMAARIPATPGVAILGDLIDSLEVVKDYAADNFGSENDNKGRFTKRGIRALLADMYLWRGCLLKNYTKKPTNTPYGHIINISDVTTDSIVGKDTLKVSRTAKGKVINDAYTNALAQECFNKAIQHCDAVLDYMKAKYQENLLKNTSASTIEKTQPYPLIRIVEVTGGTPDVAYNSIFGDENSSESIFEVQFDGVNNVNGAYGKYLSNYTSSGVSTSAFVVNSLFANVNSNESAKGFGRTDFRMLETMQISQVTSFSANAVYPYIKNLASSVSANNWQEMGKGGNYTFRTSSTSDANWPVYRLSDIMLMKAEAIARKHAESDKAATASGIVNADICEGFDMVNALFGRYNPGLKPATATEQSEYKSTRLNTDRTNLNIYYGKDKTAANLLTLVYQERQREFVGEGKFWFDIVRQAEATNDPTKSLSDNMSLSTSLKNRLKLLYSLYNPVFSDEMKVNGVPAGGKLNQNPVWDRYSKK